ncbi:MAG: hypothetical protein EXR98_07205 [Gemmataceae bacterium]|nr:hypothetical protein [Gemmataceae bacterium]
MLWLFENATAELDRYLDYEMRLTPGTGTSLPDAREPLPFLKSGVPLYDATEAWIKHTWGEANRMPVEGRQRWWLLLGASRGKPADKNAALKRWADWLASARDVPPYDALAPNQLRETLAASKIESGERSHTPLDEEPRKLLWGWHDITNALKMQHRQRNDVKSLNERFGGPIKHHGAGTRPMVYLDDLLNWWNKLAVQEQELANQRDGAKLSADAQHNYGRDGKAAPEIGGGVKKRRRDKRT